VRSNSKWRKKLAEKKIVALFDLHVPFHIRLTPVWEFIQDFKPTTVILGGDAHDWTAVSDWLSDQSRALDGGTIKGNYKELEESVLKPLKKANRDCPVIFLTGNHEDRLTRAARADPNKRGYLELENNLDQKKYNLKILPVNEGYQAGKNLVYIHGLYVNQFHAKKTVEAYHTSVLYGHVHDFQAYTLVSPVNVKHFYKGQSCGCLCNLNPDFMKNRPNKWVNGFNYCYLDEESGLFWDTQVTIVDGKFYTMGRRYR
jgi:predicted MPP superfamily phosphohydrolase